MPADCDLTFAELRLANMLESHPADLPHAPYVKPMREMLDKLDDATLAQALAEMVVQADWLAAERGLDLALAIRNRFAAGAPPIHTRTREEIAHEFLERQRPRA